MFQVGDKVKLTGCPFDEQIVEELLMYTWMKNKVQVVTRVSDPEDLDIPADYIETEGKVTMLPSKKGQWIKTDHIADWTDSVWFKKVQE